MHRRETLEQLYSMLQNDVQRDLPDTQINPFPHNIVHS